MEYVQERVATLHDFGDANPSAPTGRAAVVVPMTGGELRGLERSEMPRNGERGAGDSERSEKSPDARTANEVSRESSATREHANLAAERVFSALERVDPSHVYVALRAAPDRARAVADWLSGFDVPATVLWCNAPGIEAQLEERGLDGDAGKGRDVWLALGVAGAHDYVVVHDADATSYDATQVPRLLAPLAGAGSNYEFAKGYYARVEDGQLYGRLFRLFVRPLLRAIDEEHDAPIVEYLLAFRYALAGEFATTGDLARSMRAQPGWGLEIGTLGEAFDAVGFEGSAQVDLGVHRHDHRGVQGPRGLGDMASEVRDAVLRVLADHGVRPDLSSLPERYRLEGERAVERYAADAAFNDLEYDRGDERAQVETYAEAIRPLREDRRLPPWDDADLDAGDVLALSEAGLDR